jgi:hypothetical protein
LDQFLDARPRPRITFHLALLMVPPGLFTKLASRAAPGLAPSLFRARPGRT